MKRYIVGYLGLLHVDDTLRFGFSGLTQDIVPLQTSEDIKGVVIVVQKERLCIS